MLTNKYSENGKEINKLDYVFKYNISIRVLKRKTITQSPTSVVFPDEISFRNVLFKEWKKDI